tara:strand:+ start:35179 stop:37005 length:1827 start_codon:yes stop_codon:yes gene_type:complete
MGFLKDFIQAPIGQAPSRTRGRGGMGVRPILREPGLGMPERSIFEQPNPFLPPQTPITPPVNITDPVLPRMKPPIIPPKPPSIGGVGGINKNFRPLEDRGFGPGIRRSEDFFRPEKLMMPSVPPSAPPAINIGGPALDTSLIPQREILERPIIPPRRDDFMSIERIGNTDDMARLPKLPLQTTPPDFVKNIGNNPPKIPRPMIAELPPERIAEIGDPIPVTGGKPPVEVEPIQPIVSQPAPVEPAAVAPTAGAVPTQTEMPMGAIDPVLLQQQTSEKLTDPLIRSLYFGTQDSPGFFQQLQQAGSNLIGSDVPLQQTAGLSPLELLARQQAVAGIGGFEPFLQQNRDLVNQAIEQSRRAEGLQDPYYTQAEEIYKDTMGAYDPSMTQQFYNPYEDAVVQQTIEDVMKAGDKQDIAARAREISSGAFGGSRARLGAEERRQDLGEGLAKALSGIRQTGFTQAQSTGLGEFARQQAAKRTGAQGLMGIGVGRGSAASALGSQLAGYGSQIGGIGQTQEGLRAGQRGELAGFGGTGRGIAETGLGRIFEQQVGQQYRPIQTLGQIGSMLPGYQASQTQIDSGYGMPTDPSAAGLGAAFSAYGALAPRQGSS